MEGKDILLAIIYAAVFAGIIFAVTKGAKNVKKDVAIEAEKAAKEKEEREAALLLRISILAERRSV